MSETTQTESKWSPANGGASSPSAGSVSSGPARRIRGNILVIDDNPITAAMLSKFLKKQGYRVHASTDTVEAMNTELPFVPGVVLMDAMMPNLSGFDMTKMLKQGMGKHDIRIIMLTALRRDEDKERARLAGADDYLTKPVDRKKLLAAIERQLGDKRSDGAIDTLKAIVTSPDTLPAEKITAVIETLKEHHLLDSTSTDNSR